MSLPTPALDFGHTKGVRQRIRLSLPAVRAAKDFDPAFREALARKVGRLGTFTTRELTLRPGTYTVVGSRRGFRDVRLELVVRPDQDLATLRVSCEDKI